MKEWPHYANALRSFDSQVDEILEKYPLISSVLRQNALNTEKEFKITEAYKKAVERAIELGISDYELLTADNCKKFMSDPALSPLLTTAAHPDSVINMILVDEIMASQYWHMTGLPDNQEDLLPVTIISRWEDKLTKIKARDYSKAEETPEDMLQEYEFANPTSGAAYLAKVITDKGYQLYLTSTLPVDDILKTIRETASEWHSLALASISGVQVKGHWDLAPLAWNAAPDSIKEIHINAVRNLARAVWEFHLSKEKSKHRNEPVVKYLPPLQTDFIETNAGKLFRSFSNSLVTKAYTESEDSRWPTADLTTKDLRAVARVKPDAEIEPYLYENEISEWQNRMTNHVMAMDDLTADVLDIISAAWIRSASHPDSTIEISADDFLSYRGLLPQKSGQGRRGGYKNEQRHEIARHISILDNTWLTVLEMNVTEMVEGKNGKIRKRTKYVGESKAVVVSSRLRQVRLDGTNEEPFAWRIRPGDCFTKFLLGEGRETAFLSQKALNYDPIKQKWEKRLTRYLSWLWRINKGQSKEPPAISTILSNGIMEDVDSKNPNRTKDRLEKALDRLLVDGVISAWQYTSEADEAIVGQRGWVNSWLKWKIEIEPPQTVLDQYTKIKLPSPKVITETIGTNLGEQLKIERLKRNLSQIRVAEEVGINRSRISKIENGDTMTKPEAKKVQKWLSEIAQ